MNPFKWIAANAFIGSNLNVDIKLTCGWNIWGADYLAQISCMLHGKLTEAFEASFSSFPFFRFSIGVLYCKEQVMH